MRMTIDGSQVSAFAVQLRQVPREMQTGLRRTIRESSKDLTRQIKANAAWSDRIPGAVKTRVGFGQRSAGVQVHVDAGQAPHARPLERGNTAGGATNRHPVFGGPAFVNQPTRPFFMRAVRRAEPELVKGVQQAIDEVFDRL